MKGKVYQNRMVDVKVSNNKLYHRAIRIVSEITQVSLEEAEENILKAIYQTETISDEIRKLPVSHHILQSAAVTLIVPKAILMSIKKFNLESATQALKQQPIIRKALQNMLTYK